MTSPVTQVAEVAVKRALMNPMLIPSLEAIGRFNRNAPMKMIKAKLDTMILVGEILVSFIFLFGCGLFNILDLSSGNAELF